MAPMPLDRPGEAGRDRVVHTSATSRWRTSGAVSGSRPSPPFRLPCPIRLVSERWRGDQAQHGDKQQRIELAPHGVTPPSPSGAGCTACGWSVHPRIGGYWTYSAAQLPVPEESPDTR